MNVTDINQLLVNCSIARTKQFLKLSCKVYLYEAVSF